MTIAETPAAVLKRVASLPCWRGKVEPRPLEGGLSNKNFIVDDGGEKFVVRVGGDVAEHRIVRSRDIAVSNAAYRAGLSPEPVFALADVQVIRFVEGDTLREADVAEAEMLARIVPLVRTCHQELAGHLADDEVCFDALKACQSYGKTLVDTGYRLARDIPALLELGQKMADAGAGYGACFCHNDLLAANFIDDGRRLWLIDWEYGGLNNPLFDLANLASNNKFSRDTERSLLELYFDRSPDDTLWQSFLSMKVLSLLREAMWSMTAEKYSDLDIDYAAYTDEQRIRLSAAQADLKGS